MGRVYSTIAGSGSCIPDKVMKNEDFLDHQFYKPDGTPIPKENNISEIERVSKSSNSRERRYASENQSVADMGLEAAVKAIESAGIDPEEIGEIIVAHNFGNVNSGRRNKEGKIERFTFGNTVPTIASEIKGRLGIKNPYMPAYDISFGCPGGLRAVIMADQHIRAGDYKYSLVIGAEILSKTFDPFNTNLIIFGDAAGSLLLKRSYSEDPVGILASMERTDTINTIGDLKIDQKTDPLDYLTMGKSINPYYKGDNSFLGMMAKQVYIYVSQAAPPLIHATLKKAGLELKDVNMMVMHQANERLVKETVAKTIGASVEDIPSGLLPMVFDYLANSSVATNFVIYDMIIKNKLPGYSIKSGDIVLFYSVGASMSESCFIHKQP